MAPRIAEPPAAAATGATASTTVPPCRPPPRAGVPRRLLNSYLRQLSVRPLRTKMLTSTILFFLGDSIAQFGIEGRKLSLQLTEDGTGESKVGEDSGEDGKWDPIRAARLMFYGGTIFAPLAHNWLNLLQRVELGSKLQTLTARVALDQLVWGPFIVCLFWGSNGILEGKSPSQVVDKVKMAFLPVYKTSLCVFGPTAAFNFAFVPLQHRLLVGQSVGLGWNTYMSYLNHVNNKRLAAASVALSSAESKAASGESVDVERERAVLASAQARKEKIRSAQGGGATGVGTRMGP